MRGWTAGVLYGLLAVVATAAPGVAQTPDSVETGTEAPQSRFWMGAGFGSFAGTDFRGTPGGPTIGVGYHLGFSDGVTEASFAVEHARYGGHGFVGPTRQFDYGAALRRRVRGGLPAVLVGVRFGYSTRSLSVAEEPARTEGFLAGPTASARAPVRGGPILDVSIDLLYAAYEEYLMYASREYGTDQDGLRWVLRVGILLP